eukprot:COSAG06_NODE_9153_length_1972_cov_8.404698_2_plen_329_part_00
MLAVPGATVRTAAVVENEKAAARRFVEQVASQMERSVMKDLSDLRDVISDEMGTSSIRIERLSLATGRLKVELINAQRAAMVAGMEAAQASATAATAEEQRREALHRAKIATDRLAKSGTATGTAVAGAAAAAAAASSPPSSYSYSSVSPSPQVQQQAQQQAVQQQAVVKELKEALGAAINGRRAAEEEALEAATRAAKADARYATQRNATCFIHTHTHTHTLRGLPITGWLAAGWCTCATMDGGCWTWLMAYVSWLAERRTCSVRRPLPPHPHPNPSQHCVRRQSNRMPTTSRLSLGYRLSWRHARRLAMRSCDGVKRRWRRRDRSR